MKYISKIPRYRVTIQSRAVKVDPLIIIIKSDFEHVEVTVGTHGEIPRLVTSVAVGGVLGVDHLSITPPRYTTVHQQVLFTPRAPGGVGGVNVDGHQPLTAQDHVLVEVIVEHDRTVHAAREMSLTAGRRHAHRLGVFGGDPGDPCVVGAELKKLVIVGVEHVVRSGHPTDDGVGGTTFRIYINIVTVTEDGQKSQLDGVGPRE